MKKLISLSAFESKKIDRSSCRMVFGGTEGTNSSSTEKTSASYGCTESSTTTTTDNSDGTKCVSRTTTENCP